MLISKAFACLLYATPIYAWSIFTRFNFYTTKLCKPTKLKRHTQVKDHLFLNIFIIKKIEHNYSKFFNIFFYYYLPLGANIYDLISLREAKVVISLNIKQRYEKKSRIANLLIHNLKCQCL